MQLKTWKGKFGDDYTDRNVVNWRVRQPVFARLLEGLDIDNVLEVGCNRGHNLVALRGLGYSVVGTEPNQKAREIAWDNELLVYPGGAQCLWYGNEAHDLVFTCGVLIHVPPESLPTALFEIHRVSGRYIMAIEYFAEEEVMIPYRGHDDLLWKRDFGKLYREQFPDLYLICVGELSVEEFGDEMTYWVFEKRQC